MLTALPLAKRSFTSNRPKGRARNLSLERLERRLNPSAYSTAVLADDPSAYYRLGELSGGTAADSSGDGHTGSYSGDPSLGQSGALAGDSDASARFNGIDYYSGSLVDTNFNPADSSFAIEAWVNPGDAINQEWVIAGESGRMALAYNAWDGYSPPIDGFHARAGYVGIGFFNGSTFSVTQSSSTLPPNQWSYLVGSWNDSTKSLDLYINGTLDRTTTFGGGSPVSGDPFGYFQVGGFDVSLHGGIGQSEFFKGGIDEVAYYPSALSPAQVQAHFTAAGQSTNTAPTLGPVVAPTEPVPAGSPSPVIVTSVFSDPDVSDTHTVVWNWGDGQTTTQDLAASAPTDLSASHYYASAGVYTVTVTITDGPGASATGSSGYVVVYDPSAGFVTGGGWVDSPAGAYTANPAATGKANFGFVSKYQKGGTVPDGSTQFQLKVAGFDFKSTIYDWLVVTGAKAEYQGTGTVNGSGNYGLLLTSLDGQRAPGGGADRFRIKVWDKATGLVVYDNQVGAADMSDTADPVQAIGGGSIQIHDN